MPGLANHKTTIRIFKRDELTEPRRAGPRGEAGQQATPKTPEATMKYASAARPRISVLGSFAPIAARRTALPPII